MMISEAAARNTRMNQNQLKWPVLRVFLRYSESSTRSTSSCLLLLEARSRKSALIRRPNSLRSSSFSTKYPLKPPDYFISITELVSFREMSIKKTKPLCFASEALSNKRLNFTRILHFLFF